VHVLVETPTILKLRIVAEEWYRLHWSAMVIVCIIFMSWAFKVIRVSFRSRCGPRCWSPLGIIEEKCIDVDGGMGSERRSRMYEEPEMEDGGYTPASFWTVINLRSIDGIRVNWRRESPRTAEDLVFWRIDVEVGDVCVGVLQIDVSIF
jgi:hypothetical protein